MVLSRWNLLAALALASAGLAGYAATADDKPAGAEEEIIIRAFAAPGPDGHFFPGNLQADHLFAFVADGADEVSPYWIGVQLEPPTDILKQHLNLEGGMVAVHVFEGSPAEKAGLKVNDIILKAGESYVKEPGDLLKCVGEAKGNEITLVILRRGKETPLKVTPAKRPQEANPQGAKETETEEKEAVKKLSAALDLYKKHSAAAAGEARAVDVLRVRPGVLAGAAAMHLELPKDVSVTITKEGSGPAKIIVKKDGKEYQTTDDKLNQLPDDVRGYVQVIRGGGAGPLVYQARTANPVTTKIDAIKRGVPAPALPIPATSAETAKVYRYHVESKHAAGEVDSKLDQILKIVSQQEDSSVSALRKEVQQLRKELEELRKVKN